MMSISPEEDGCTDKSRIAVPVLHAQAWLKLSSDDGSSASVGGKRFRLTWKTRAPVH